MTEERAVNSNVSAILFLLLGTGIPDSPLFRGLPSTYLGYSFKQESIICIDGYSTNFSSELTGDDGQLLVRASPPPLKLSLDGHKLGS
jgi:hypothetical protein